MREGNESQRRRAERNAPITERLIDDGERAPEALTGAAEEAFERDQRTDPDHPTRIKREMTDARGIQDPAHSRGTRKGK